MYNVLNFYRVFFHESSSSNLALHVLMGKKIESDQFWPLKFHYVLDVYMYMYVHTVSSLSRVHQTSTDLVLLFCIFNFPWVQKHHILLLLEINPLFVQLLRWISCAVHGSSELFRSYLHLLTFDADDVFWSYFWWQQQALDTFKWQEITFKIKKIARMFT